MKIILPFLLHLRKSPRENFELNDFGFNNTLINVQKEGWSWNLLMMTWSSE